MLEEALQEINSEYTWRKPKVSVVVPLYNEEKNIGNFIESLLNQDYPKDLMEWMFIDGGSNDNTVKILNNYKEQYPKLIKLFFNNKKTVPYAMNIGIQEAAGEYVVRFDAHSIYADDYISKCVYYLETTGADNVGGPMVAEGKTELQKVIAASYHSKFALGGGKFHDRNYEGFADTVYLGAYRRQKLIEIGMYDEKFTRNQDDELNYRLIKSGGKIYITPQIKSIYYPRNNYKQLFSQYFQYGEWKPAVITKHGLPARLSHLIPAAFVSFILFGLFASLILPAVSFFYFFILLLYIIINFIFSIGSKNISGIKNKMRLMLIHFLLHISYGSGFIYGLFKPLIANLKGLVYENKKTNCHC